ncbi:hypothetical protein Tco_0809284 [Tanacetum coccineum]
MLGPGRYSQWRSRFLRYIDTKPNGGGLKKSILSGPYEPTTVQVQAVEAAEGRPAVPQHTSVKTILNMTPENKEHFQSEKEAIFLAFNRIEMKMLLKSVDACNPANKCGYAIESYNRFVTIAAIRKDRHRLNHRRLNILKQFQLRSKATSSSTRPSASTRHKGKEIAKPITPQSESVSVSDEDSDPEQAQRDKEMQKNLALLAKYFKKLYKPTNNNLRTSSNSRNKTEDTTPRYNNDNQSRQFGNQRTMTVARARETVGSQLSKLKDTNEEIDEQELEAHYSYMAKIQEVSPEESSSTGQPLEQKDDSNVTPDSSNICTNDNQVDLNASRNVVDELDCAC